VSPLRTSILTIALLAAAAGLARAEEMLVLDNGTILQGTVLRDADGVIQFRLSGVGTESRVEVRRDRIVKRFSTLDPSKKVVSYSDLAPRELETPTAATPPPPPAPAPLPAEEPDSTEESFFDRFLRLAALAFPADGPSRVFLAILAFVVVLCLVGLGGRVSDLSGLTLGRSTALAAAFCAGAAANLLFPDVLLRADRGVWVIPLQVLAWVGLAAALLRCGVGRAVSLLAFVVFTAGIVAFASGALLVTV
jgi:hypothetical protein